jgi:hypothetical protein
MTQQSIKVNPVRRQRLTSELIHQSVKATHNQVSASPSIKAQSGVVRPHEYLCLLPILRRRRDRTAWGGPAAAAGATQQFIDNRDDLPNSREAPLRFEDNGPKQNCFVNTSIAAVGRQFRWLKSGLQSLDRLMLKQSAG